MLDNFTLPQRGRCANFSVGNVLLPSTHPVFSRSVKKCKDSEIHYREKNVIAESEPYIIAVNGNKVPYAWDDEIPYIVQAVLPFGLPTIWVNWDAPEKSATGYAHRPEIKKAKGGVVSTNIFFRREYEGISGILFSRVGIHEFRSEMGRDFIFVHNPLASNKLPEGWLRVGREYRVEGNSLECRRWSR